MNTKQRQPVLSLARYAESLIPTAVDNDYKFGWPISQGFRMTAVGARRICIANDS